MKVVALVSGGKDSCYAMQLCHSYGHDVVALANLFPLDEAVDELDSYMYQTVGHQVITALSQCMGLPLFRRKIQGKPRAKNLRYTETDGDEVEDLEVLLKAVKRKFPGIGGVSTGAIASDYQRLRVENVCSRLGLVSLAYLWKQDQASLLQKMIDSGLHAILVKVAAMGLDPQKHLGKDLSTLQPLFLRLKDLYGCNVCGEGGEYESLTLDCPLFLNAKIVLDEFTIEFHSADSIAPVGVLHPVKFHLEAKSDDWIPDTCLTTLCMEVSDDLMLIEENVKDRNESSTGEAESSLKSTSDLRKQELKRKPKLVTTVNKQRHGFVGISCWEETDKATSQEVQDKLDDILEEIGMELQDENLCWADVIYVHLYLKDMATFAEANANYVEHITDRVCVRGVPSRCCVQLPLMESGLGSAMVEILAVRDESKTVLHVQSISCWAPSCIGPYSQATLFKQLLYMAGQLGLDPPTMNLVSGGGACQMVQALRNCEAVATVFTSTFLNSVLSFLVYCSSAASLKERHQVEQVLNEYLSCSQESAVRMEGNEHGTSKVAIFASSAQALVLYILVPALPKGALVEIAPLVYTSPSWIDFADEAQSLLWEKSASGLSREDDVDKHEFGKDLDDDNSLESGEEDFICAPCKGLILHGYMCRAFVSISTRTKRSSRFLGHSNAQAESSCDSEQIAHTHNFSVCSNQTIDFAGSVDSVVPSEEIACGLPDAISKSLQSLSLVLDEASLCWDDVFTFRLFFVVKKTNAFDLRRALDMVVFRYCEGKNRQEGSKAPIPKPMLIPVLGIGGTAEMHDVIAAELTACRAAPEDTHS